MTLRSTNIYSVLFVKIPAGAKAKPSPYSFPTIFTIVGLQLDLGYSFREYRFIGNFLRTDFDFGRLRFFFF